jgi:hypothetical protein
MRNATPDQDSGTKRTTHRTTTLLAMMSYCLKNTVPLSTDALAYLPL